MNEFLKQSSFFTKTISSKKSKNQKALNLYKDLVFHRFNEVLSNANPIFYENIETKKFEKLVREFMKSGAKTDLIWQVPNEFRTFIKKQKEIKKKFPYIDDLLWFEWIEIKLLMQDYTNFKYSKFSKKSSYRLSKSAKIKKLSYKVYERDFETKGEFYLLSYYDFEKYEVIYREISEFMYVFLKLISKMSIDEALSKSAKENKISKKELNEVLKEPLKQLCSLGILSKKD